MSIKQEIQVNIQISIYNTNGTYVNSITINQDILNTVFNDGNNFTMMSNTQTQSI